jgi:hypothetical protein
MCRIRRSAWRDELSIRRKSVIVRETRPENIRIFNGKMTIDGGTFCEDLYPRRHRLASPTSELSHMSLGFGFALEGAIFQAHPTWSSRSTLWRCSCATARLMGMGVCRPGWCIQGAISRYSVVCVALN